MAAALAGQASGARDACFLRRQKKRRGIHRHDDAFEMQSVLQKLSGLRVSHPLHAGLTARSLDGGTLGRQAQSQSHRTET